MTTEEKQKDRLEKIRAIFGDDAISDLVGLKEIAEGMYFLLGSFDIWKDDDGIGEEKMQERMHQNKLKYRRIVRNIAKKKGVGANEVHAAYMSCSLEHPFKDAYNKISKLSIWED